MNHAEVRAGAMPARWAELVFLGAVVSSAVWYAWGVRAGPWPLLLAGLPWLAAARFGRWTWRPTRFEAPLALFVLTALIGVWAAYDRDVAWAKFWLLVASANFFYALAIQPRENVWYLFGFFGALGLAVGLGFVMVNDWAAQPGRLSFFNQLGQWWMNVRPTGSSRFIHPNGAGGMMAILVPFQVAILLRSRRRQPRLAWATAAMLALTGLVMLMAGSHGAFVALGAGLGAWASWEVVRRQGLRWRVAPDVLYGVGALFVLALAGISLFVVADRALNPGGGSAVISSLDPNQTYIAHRLRLYDETLVLIRDFPFTGGGLGSFPGLHGQYVLGIPFFFLIYSHHFLLNVALEQGLPGLSPLLLILAGTGWLLWRGPRPAGTDDATASDRIWRWALAASLIAALIHGQVSDVLYGHRGTPLLFFLTGLTVAVTEPWRGADRHPGRVWFQSRLLLTSLAAVLILTATFIRPLLAAAYGNLGALAMARIELAGWPRNGWDEEAVSLAMAARLAPSGDLLREARRLNPNQRTANHRLGLIALMRRDFDGAVGFLERAHAVDPDHPGIRKNLGLSYLWAGRLDDSQPFLVPVPQIVGEMDAYAWYWPQQGRDDLGHYAAEMAARLRGVAAATSSSR